MAGLEKLYIVARKYTPEVDDKGAGIEYIAVRTLQSTVEGKFIEPHYDMDVTTFYDKQGVRLSKSRYPDFGYMSLEHAIEACNILNSFMGQNTYYFDDVDYGEEFKVYSVLYSIDELSFDFPWIVREEE